MAGQTHALSRAEPAVVAAVVQIPLDRWGQCANKGANCDWECNAGTTDRRYGRVHAPGCSLYRQIVWVTGPR